MGAGRSLVPSLSVRFLEVQTGNILPATRGLVDSGADSSMFPIDWAARLGIDIQADCVESENSTAGGKVKSYVYPPGVDAIIMGAKVHLGATFTETLDIVLLGRRDFFARYKVTVDESTQTFTVELHASAP